MTARLIRAGARGRRALVLGLIGALLVGGLVAVAPEPRADAALPPGFSATPVMTGLTLPTAIAFSPDGKVYVAEKSGIIRVYPNASSNSGTVFKDLSPKVFDGWDRGLLGLTVDPRLGNGTGHDFVYALYSRDAPNGVTPPYWNDRCPTPPGPHTDGCIIGGTLSRIPVNANGTAGAEQPIIDNEWCQQFTSHSVGHIEFGPDGYLYVTGGEGASYDNADWGQFGGSLANTPTPKNPCGDPPGGVGGTQTAPTARGGAMRAQSMRRPAGEPRLLNGSLLRINPDTGAGVPGNPQYSAGAPSANASRVIAYGLRNSFRFTNRPGTSEIWTGDVGWGDWEEINRIPTPTPAKALNFGWPCIEGAVQLAGYRDLDQCKALYSDTTDPATAPYFAYEHYKKVNASDTCTITDGSAISGIQFYTGARYPAQYQNALFFGDQARNCLFVATAGANGLPDPSTIKPFIASADNPYPVDIETDPASKDLFFVNIGLGTVNRISYASSNRAPTASASATPTSGNAPLAVQLNGSASSDPDGDPLTYSWDTDGNGTFGDATGPAPTVTYANGGTFQARLMVSDTGGLTATSAPITITVTTVTGPTNTSPPTISGTPAIGSTLSSTDGLWNGSGITYTRQWQRCTTTTNTGYAATIAADGPSQHWRLGETTGTTAADASGKNRPGTYVGGVTLNQAGAITGDTDRAVSLDGNDDRIARSPADGISGNALSVDLWVKTTNTTKEGTLVSYAVPGQTEEFQLRDQRGMDVYVKGARVYTGVSVTDGQWHHLAVTWTSTAGALRVYKDGVLAYSGTLASGASLTAGGALVLGQDQDSLNGGFDPAQAYLGQLDEVALYPSVLSAAQVAAHRQAGLTGTGGGTTTTCADIAGATNQEYSPQLADQGKTFRLAVTATNAGGSSTVTSAAVGPVTAGAGNTPPVPVIDTPANGFSWKAGDNVTFSGHATDAEDGNEPGTRLSWGVILGHCTTLGCHQHPVATVNGSATGDISAPDHEAPSYLELTLTATDAVGATTSVVRRVDPLTTTLTFESNPQGLDLAVGAGNTTATPFTQLWVVNSQVQLYAPPSQIVGGTTYTFGGWSDGGASTHIVNAPATNTTYTATYSGTCTPTTYAAAVGADSPSYFWRLGDTSGTAAADSSGHNRPGTYVNGVVLNQPGALAGDTNRAVTLDGSNDRIGRNPAAGITGTAVTMELWLKTTSTKSAGIVSYAVPSSAEELELRNPGNLRVYVKGTASPATGVKLNDGLWHHLAVTWTSSGGAVRVYKDGALAFSGTLRSGTTLTSGGALVLGQDQDSVNGGFETAQAFPGQLDELALYPTALSAARVQAHRSAGLGTTCAATATKAAARSFLNETR